MICYQHIGLTEQARIFIESNCKRKPIITCDKCGNVIEEGMDCDFYEHLDLFYGDGPDLHIYIYKLKDGREAKEVVQEAPWFSGPMGYLCLEIEGKKEFEWAQEVIEKG